MTDSISHREKLARVIEPEAWAMRDRVLEKLGNEKAQKALVEDSFKLADRIIASGLMASETWERSEYLQARKHILERTSRRGYCYSVSDILDGYFMHDPRCERWPQGAIGGSGCITER
jgi:hypothetical protein